MLGFLSWQRVNVYENAETLWTDTLAHNPSAWIAHTDVGQALFAKGQTNAAIQQYELALQLEPRSPETHYDDAVALFQNGQVDEAIAHYQKALEIYPSFLEAHINLAAALLREDETPMPSSSTKPLSRSNPLRPRPITAWATRTPLPARWLTPSSNSRNRSNSIPTIQCPQQSRRRFLQLGDAAKALPQFQEALRLDPGNGLGAGQLGQSQRSPRPTADQADEVISTAAPKGAEIKVRMNLLAAVGFFTRMVVALTALEVFAGPLRAEDWTTTDGKVYHDVTVLKTDPDAVTILDHDGGALVPLSTLSPDLQKRFNYDPAKAAIAAAERQSRTLKARRRCRSSPRKPRKYSRPSRQGQGGGEKARGFKSEKSASRWNAGRTSYPGGEQKIGDDALEKPKN